MFVETKDHYSPLFTNLVGWHARAVSFPLSDVILAQLACPLSDIMFCLQLTYLSTNIASLFVLSVLGKEKKVLKDWHQLQLYDSLALVISSEAQEEGHCFILIL
jgi:hypothetical protein